MSRHATTRRSFLKASTVAASAVALRGSNLLAQATLAYARIDILPAEPIGTISPEIYSHFIEQLGGVIYDGVWVGEGSKIPNEKGIRKAFIDTMRAVKVPVLRWPGGCCADSYDWRDGIGPAAKRPARTGFWDQQNSNQYGLHEFMHTCRAIGCKPYLAADLRSLPARDFYQEIEYCNAAMSLQIPLPRPNRTPSLRSARPTAILRPSTSTSGVSETRAGGAAAT
jgi:alpha-L-arabinofuranosidase